MSRGTPKAVKELLDKSKDTALQAVTIYNDPRSTFRTGSYAVLMIIAWTSLFHAYFEKKNIKYFYTKKPEKEDNLFPDKKKTERIKYEMVDGEKKAWQLDKCLQEHFESDVENPVRKNLELFVRLRNRIEHRNLKGVDSELYGESQALLQNYNKYLKEFFGEKENISECFFIPINFNPHHITMPESKKEKDVIKFIKEYRNSLNTDIRNSQEYQFKVYLIPKIGNHRSSSDIALEFIPFDENNAEEMEKYNKGIVFIKEKEKIVHISNASMLKPGEVVKRLNEHFNCNNTYNMTWHVNKWKEHKIRPENKDKKPDKTETKYCVYDKPHKDYLYTEEWVKLLISEIEKKE